MSRYLDLLIERYPVLGSIKEDIASSYRLIESTYANGGKLLIGGNGGSCADSEHMVGELMKGFVKKRALSEEFRANVARYDAQIATTLLDGLEGALPAIAITGHTALTTAFANDVDPSLSFAQQVYGYGRATDTLLCISTSGNAKNLVYAAVTAKAKDMKVILLSGKDGGRLRALADVSIIVPSDQTHQIQELHLPIYHTLCLMLEDRFF